MLPPDVIAAIRVFMERVQLSGKEVPAYTKVMMCLANEENEIRIKLETEMAARKAASVPRGVKTGKNGAGKTTEESSPKDDTPLLDSPEGPTPPAAE